MSKAPGMARVVAEIEGIRSRHGAVLVGEDGANPTKHERTVDSVNMLSLNQMWLMLFFGAHVAEVLDAKPL